MVAAKRTDTRLTKMSWRPFALQAALNIVVTGEDNDANYPKDNGPTIEWQQAAKIDELIEWAGVDKAKVLAAYNVGQLGDLPAAMFDAVCKAVRQRGEQNGKS